MRKVLAFIIGAIVGSGAQEARIKKLEKRAKSLENERNHWKKIICDYLIELELDDVEWCDKKSIISLAETKLQSDAASCVSDEEYWATHKD